MANIPNIHELRRKAEETRAEAETFATRELRTQMMVVAAEYERLAIRAEEYEERARLGITTPHLLENWLK